MHMITPEQVADAVESYLAPGQHSSSPTPIPGFVPADNADQRGEVIPSAPIADMGGQSSTFGTALRSRRFAENNTNGSYEIERYYYGN